MTPHGAGSARSGPSTKYTSDVDTLDVLNVCVVPIGDTLRRAGLKVEP